MWWSFGFCSAAMDQLALTFALQLWSSFGFCSAAMEQHWILLCSYGSALDFALQM
jgi:hypothetical protein